MSKEIVDLEGQLLRATEKAILVSPTGDEEDGVWLPRSQLEYLGEPKDGIVEFSVPEWLAVEKGLV